MLHPERDWRWSDDPPGGGRADGIELRRHGQAPAAGRSLPVDPDDRPHVDHDRVGNPGQQRPRDRGAGLGRPAQQFRVEFRPDVHVPLQCRRLVPECPVDTRRQPLQQCRMEVLARVVARHVEVYLPPGEWDAAGIAHLPEDRQPMADVDVDVDDRRPHGTSRRHAVAGVDEVPVAPGVRRDTDAVDVCGGDRRAGEAHPRDQHRDATPTCHSWQPVGGRSAPWRWPRPPRFPGRGSRRRRGRTPSSSRPPTTAGATSWRTGC